MKSLLRNIFIIFLGFAFISDISAKDSGTTSADKVTDARQRLDSCLADITNGNYIRALSNGYMFMNQMKNSPEGTFTNEEKARCLFYLGNVNYAFQNYNASIRYYVESSRIPLRGKDAELRKKILPSYPASQKTAALQKTISRSLTESPTGKIRRTRFMPVSSAWPYMKKISETSESRSR